MVHGSMQDHRASAGLVGELAAGVATFSMDRRGFGASGDAPEYAIEREFEDVAAVVDAVADRTGSAVSVWGHSYGANCAMGGAARSSRVDHLVLYEPSLSWSYPPGALESIEQKVAAGDREGALLEVLVDLVGMTDEEVEMMRNNPAMPWADRLATVPTVPRECRTEAGWVYQPGQFDDITAPTLMLSGAESADVVKDATHRAAEAIGDVEIRELEGQGHFAHRTDPAMVAGIVREFVGA
jgi:pimeloyl-ACP methyl ester carboxylesterase